MKLIAAIPLVSKMKPAKKKQLPPTPHVPAEYGKILTGIQKDLGLTDRQLADLAGRKAGKKDLTMYRLRTGTGSFKSARDVRNALIARGATVPPLPSGDQTSTDGEPWKSQWLALGERLHANATDEQYHKWISTLTEFVESLEQVKRHMVAISHTLPRAS